MTEVRRFKIVLLQALCALCFVIILSNSFVADAQNVRLRSNVKPQCTSTGNFKFSDITADGNIAVMGSYNCRGAWIFDISNPDAPVQTAWYNPGGNQQFLEAVVVGNRAYFGAGGNVGGGGGVHIVDISNPAAPILLGRVTSANGGGYDTIHEMVVSGNYLYENSNSTGNLPLKVIDISNPAAPRLVRNITVNNSGWVHAMTIKGDRMFTSGFYGTGLTEIYDISNIESIPPRLLGQVVTGSNTHSNWVSEDGNWLYVAREFIDGDLRVYNITNAASPQLTKVIKASDLNINAICPHNPMVKDNKLYVAWYQGGVQVFDLTNPGDPKRIGQYDTFSPAFNEEAARTAEDSLKLEFEDEVCNSAALLNNNVPSSYDGNWTAFPLLGSDKVLLSDLTSGLYVVDASRATAAPRNKVADFDGDGKTDFSRFTGASGAWTIENSSNGANVSTGFGIASDRIVPADYDGDGRSDIGVFRDGAWYVIQSSNNTFLGVQFGQTGDVPVASDYDGDGKSDVAVFRPATNTWYLNRSTLGFYGVRWGATGDEPVAGDYDGDGKTDIAVVRGTSGSKVWYILQSTSSILRVVQFGINNDKTLVADFDGDQITDFAVFRPSANSWYILKSRDNSFTGVQFGLGSDVHIPADFDGDSKADIAVYRPSTGAWYSLNSSNGAFVARQFGAGNDLPAPCAAQPQLYTGCQ